MIKRNPVLWFFLLAFGISWAGMVPLTLYGRDLISFTSPIFNLIGGLGPTIAAVIVAAALKGWGGVKDLFRSLLQGRVGTQWYLVAFFGMALLAALGLVPLFLVQGITPEWGGFGPLFMLAPIFLINLLSNVWEEIGWRGFALPRLQARYSALTASIILGVLWAVWHVPMLMNPQNAMSSFPWYVTLVNMAAMSVIYAWIYNSTRGSLLLVTLFHAASNTVAFFLNVTLSAGAFAVHYGYLTTVIIVAAVIVVWVFGARSLSREPDAPVTITDS